MTGRASSGLDVLARKLLERLWLVLESDRLVGWVRLCAHADSSFWCEQLVTLSPRNGCGLKLFLYGGRLPAAVDSM